MKALVMLAVILAVMLTPIIGHSQAPVISSVVNAASFAPLQPISPGSLVSILGTGLATSTAGASVVPLPNSIAGVSVTFSGIVAPLMFVSPNQINLQVPWGTQTGTADMVVTVDGRSSAAFRAQVVSASPGIFTIPPGSRQAVATYSNGFNTFLAGPYGSSIIPGVTTYPVRVGSSLTILATGLGLVTPAIADGAASRDQIRATTVIPTVLVNGSPAQVTFSGLSPEFVGVNQINIVVPESAWYPSGAGGEATLQIQLGGIRTSNNVTFEVLGKWDY
jgi:uncharacterized protein (TIGR03437 family)